MDKNTILLFGGFSGAWPNVDPGQLGGMTRNFVAREEPRLSVPSESSQFDWCYPSKGRGKLTIWRPKQETTQRAQHRAEMAEWWRNRA